jgi:hypothetical protein
MIDRYAWLGLSLGNTDPKFSLLHKMKEEHLINKLAFSFSQTYSSYLGIGETVAQEIKNNREIPCSQRGRKIWFKKSDIEKFMQKNKV